MLLLLIMSLLTTCTTSMPVNSATPSATITSEMPSLTPTFTPTATNSPTFTPTSDPTPTAINDTAITPDATALGGVGCIEGEHASQGIFISLVKSAWQNVRYEPWIAWNVVSNQGLTPLAEYPLDALYDKCGSPDGGLVERWAHIIGRGWAVEFMPENDIITTYGCIITPDENSCPGG